MDGDQFIPLTEALAEPTPVATPSSSRIPQDPRVVNPVSDFSRPSSRDNNTIDNDGSNQSNQQLDNINSTQHAFMNLNMDIVGDPFWIGAADAFPTSDAVSNSAARKNRLGDVLVAFINYYPSQNVAQVDNQQRGRFDYLTSGVYQINSISHRFQAGKFTQSLSGIKRDDLTASLVRNKLERL
jgi:hypothetical protein